MTFHSGILSALLCFGTLVPCLSLSTQAMSQDTSLPLLPKVDCQRISSDDVAADKFAVENFDKSTEAYMHCVTSAGESGTAEFFSGTVPLTSDTKLSLASFTNWSANPSGSELFISTSLGNHPVNAFLPGLLPVDIAAVDEILGYPHSSPVTQHICTTEPNASTVCTTQQVEECKVVYGRKECKMVDKEVCSTVERPTQSCRDESVIAYYRTVNELDGYVSQKTEDYCIYGMIEKQTKTVYGRVFKERRCCESQVVNGELKNVCTDWEAF